MAALNLVLGRTHGGINGHDDGGDEVRAWVSDACSCFMFHVAARVIMLVELVSTYYHGQMGEDSTERYRICLGWAIGLVSNRLCSRILNSYVDEYDPL